MNDELDLTPIAVKAIRFVRMYGWRIVIGSFLGMIIGGFIYYLLPHNYKAKMVVQSSVMANAQTLRIVNNWEDLLNKNGYPILANIFQQPNAVVSELLSINAEVIPGTDENSGMVIEVVVSDSSVIPGVQQGIMHGIGNSEYMRERLAVRRQNLEEQIAQSKSELARLDSVKPYIHSLATADNATNSRLILDVSDISTQKLACMDRIVQFQEKLKFLRGAYLLQELVPSKRSKLVPAPVLPLLGLVLGFLLSYSMITLSILKAKYFPADKPRPAS